jgi:hypothetical protein
MKKLLIGLLAGAFAATAWGQGAAPEPATPAPAKTEVKKVATAKHAPKTISVKEQLKRKSRKSAKPAAVAGKPAAGDDKPAK